MFEVKRLFALEKVQLLKGSREPSLNQVQSVAGSLQWVSRMFPWLRPFLAGLYAFFENKKAFGGNWQKIVDYELKIWELFLTHPRFITPKSFLGNRLKIEIYTDACAKSPFEKETINWASGAGIGGILVIRGKVVEFPPTGSKRKNSPVVKRDKVATQTH